MAHEHGWIETGSRKSIFYSLKAILVLWKTKYGIGGYFSGSGPVCVDGLPGIKWCDRDLCGVFALR